MVLVNHPLLPQEKCEVVVTWESVQKPNLDLSNPKVIWLSQKRGGRYVGNNFLSILVRALSQTCTLLMGGWFYHRIRRKKLEPFFWSQKIHSFAGHYAGRQLDRISLDI